MLESLRYVCNETLHFQHQNGFVARIIHISLHRNCILYIPKNEEGCSWSLFIRRGWNSRGVRHNRYSAAANGNGGRVPNVQGASTHLPRLQRSFFPSLKSRFYYLFRSRFYSNATMKLDPRTLELFVVAVLCQRVSKEQSLVKFAECNVYSLNFTVLTFI